MSTGNSLIRDIGSCMLTSGQLAFWWLGQHSFIVKLGQKVLYLDPYLTHDQGRQVPPFIKPTDLANATLIFGSHDHGDHIDRPVWPSVAITSPKIRFVVPELLVSQLVSELNIPTERFIGVDDSATVEFDGIRITGIAAAHEFLDQDHITGHYPYMGFIIEGNDCTIYHSGDTCNYEGLQTKLQHWSKIDVAFLPINGRDATRLRSGCIGNMTYQEAVDLAGAIRPKLTVPAHYDMFAMNSEDPAKFADYISVKYPDLKYWIGGYCERIVVE